MTPRAAAGSWNELHYLTWREFRQMAPPILRLEIERLGRTMAAGPLDPDFHNVLVRARFELTRFVAALNAPEARPEDGVFSEALRAAIVVLTVRPPHPDPEIEHACRYVVDRLQYVHGRLGFIH